MKERERVIHVCKTEKEEIHIWKTEVSHGVQMYA